MTDFLPVDPMQTTALHFLDFGSWYSPDGREHPITGLTPIAPDTIAAPTATVAATTTANAASNTSDGIVDKLLDKLLGKAKNIGGRLAIGALAVLLIVVVAFRLTRGGD